ncbi:MAG: hypothetical protein J7K89_05600, partial [Candidatus Cloacimonetes bacterium]|nr:hypothetical protein [Candidatus Cloacimonadota bacterium]
VSSLLPCLQKTKPSVDFTAMQVKTIVVLHCSTLRRFTRPFMGGVEQVQVFSSSTERKTSDVHENGGG